jgi:eukaryotic-like serine/threonine-protein kinase
MRWEAADCDAGKESVGDADSRRSFRLGKTAVRLLLGGELPIRAGRRMLTLDNILVPETDHLSRTAPMNLLDWLKRKSRSGNEPATAARMTWAKASVNRSLSRTGMFLKRQLWIFPILAIVVLGMMGLGLRISIERTMKANLRSQLETVRDIEAAMLEDWFRIQSSNAVTQAHDEQLRNHVYELLAEVESAADPVAALKASKVHRALQKELAPAMSAHDYHGYFVADRNKRILSSSSVDLIGETDIPEYDFALSRALDGAAAITPPYASLTVFKDETGKLRTGVPMMFVCAPIRDASFQVVGALALRIRPERGFTQILQLGRMGSTGETYAFNKDGRMVSNSRFDEQLIVLGLLLDQPGARSLLNLDVRDPQGDITANFRPQKRRSQLPLTKMAASAVAGNTGFDVDGYRDYRGVNVIGAWTWLPERQLGIATEMDVAEAFRPIAILKYTFFGLMGLLGIAAAAIFAFTVKVARLQREAQRAAVASQKLGQYTLEKKLGSGGMGIVYKGHHAVLRRPTAIKLLNVEKVNDSSLERFEREVQITCQLNHPNTVAIYDFGRTPEGVFYYAMEFLDGIDLQSLVEKYGPQPESRVIHILQQVCGSLYEAHSLGLVHRDIKPANIMLNRRGGEPDFVKVLDFGLVKAIDDQKQAGLTAANALTGTPLYMSPEAIQTPNAVDARSDLYAVGAVGYFLLTGKPVFDATTLIDLCQLHISQQPTSPSERLGHPVAADLETVLLGCLDKSRAKRPQTARELALQLGRCSSAGAWSLDIADAWWNRHERGANGETAMPLTADIPKPTPTSSYEQTVITNTPNEL